MNKKPLVLAIASAGLLASATPASAFTLAEGQIEDAGKWAFDISGYFIPVIAHAEASGEAISGRDFNGVDVSTSAEIHFQPRIELTNGMTVGANVELEGETNGDTIDESYVFVESKYGKLVMGSDNSVGYNMSLRAPSAIEIDDPAAGNAEAPIFLGDYLPVSAGVDSIYRGTLGTTKLELARNNDAKRVSYYSPSMAGLTFGLSYAHDDRQDNFGPTDCDTNAGTACRVIDTAIHYSVNISEIDIKASARHGSGKQGSTTPEVMGGGIQLGMGPVTLGSSYAEQKGHATDNGHAYDVGIVLDMPESPWAYSINFFEGENDEASGKDRYKYTLIGASYTYNQYLKSSVFFATADMDAAATNTDAKGKTGGVALTFAF